MVRKYDYLVIGGGIAGMSFALKSGPHGTSGAHMQKHPRGSQHRPRAGGVASVTDLQLDDFDKHIHDTMVAGDWLSDPKAVEK